MLRKMLERSERGQAIVLIAAAMVALIAMIGLMADGGMLFIEHGRLKRAIDAAAISAALQYRENYDTDDLAKAAGEFLILNQIDAFDIQVDTCDTLPDDDELCTNPRRKLVRVTASRQVAFSFLPVVGIYETTLTASSTGEAASVDVVLVIDTSASMAFETPDEYGEETTRNGSDPSDDPLVCNDPENPKFTTRCQPLEDIKADAMEFIREALWFPYDRAAIVTFDRDPDLILPLTDNESEVLAAIDSLTVFEPDECNWEDSPAEPGYGPCRNYDEEHNYLGLDCPRYRLGPDLILGTADDSTQNPSSCTSSNTGGALELAGAAFSGSPPDNILMREDSPWVVILLAGGPANTGIVDVPESDPPEEYPDRICPPQTWDPPWCRDDNPNSRHPSTSEVYDADDYARDMADFVANPENGQGAVIFSIGLGNLVRYAPFPNDPAAGEELLIYAAEEACKVHPHDICDGQYFFAPITADLREIFRTIAENIPTRLTR